MDGKKQLDEMRISAAKNGGFTVRHSFRPQPVNRKGAMSGGLAMDYPPTEEHVFGKGEGKEMLAHVAKHLGVSKGGGNAAGGDGEA